MKNEKNPELETLLAAVKEKISKCKCKTKGKKGKKMMKPDEDTMDKKGAKADMGMPEMDDEEDMVCKEDLNDALDSVYSYISYLSDYTYQRIWALEDSIYAHKSSGHLPVLSASQMNKMLNKCGLGEDFNVQPKTTVYASKLEVDLTKK